MVPLWLGSPLLRTRIFHPFLFMISAVTQGPSPVPVSPLALKLQLENLIELPPQKPTTVGLAKIKWVSLSISSNVDRA